MITRRICEMKVLKWRNNMFSRIFRWKNMSIVHANTKKKHSASGDILGWHPHNNKKNNRKRKNLRKSTKNYSKNWAKFKIIQKHKILNKKKVLTVATMNVIQNYLSISKFALFRFLFSTSQFCNLYVYFSFYYIFSKFLSISNYKLRSFPKRSAYKIICSKSCESD